MRVPRPYLDALRNVPPGVLPGHSVADAGDDEIVVFLVGMRVHRWHKVRSWLPTFLAMPRSLIQLSKNPDLGLLHAKAYWAGRDAIVVQYWRSVEHLGRFAKDPALAHAPAWAAFNRRAAGSGDVGVWHETYRVPAGQVETAYGNMPPFGLGKALGARERAGSPRNSTHDRMASTQPDYVEVQPD
jgi:hypothetical protein